MITFYFILTKCKKNQYRSIKYLIDIKKPEGCRYTMK